MNPLLVVKGGGEHPFRAKVRAHRQDWFDFQERNSLAATGPRAEFWGRTASDGLNLLQRPEKAELEAGKALFLRSEALIAEAMKDYNDVCYKRLTSHDFLGAFKLRASAAGLAPN